MIIGQDELLVHSAWDRTVGDGERQFSWITRYGVSNGSGADCWSGSLRWWLPSSHEHIEQFNEQSVSTAANGRSVTAATSIYSTNWQPFASLNLNERSALNEHDATNVTSVIATFIALKCLIWLSCYCWCWCCDPAKYNGTSAIVTINIIVWAAVAVTTVASAPDYVTNKSNDITTSITATSADESNGSDDGAIADFILKWSSNELMASTATTFADNLNVNVVSRASTNQPTFFWLDSVCQ